MTTKIPFPALRQSLCAALLACAGILASLPITAHADDYTDVNKMVSARQLQPALTKAEAYLADKPRDPQMRFIKGVILSEMGQSSNAMEVFTSLTVDYPELPEPYNNLAVLYAQQEQFDKARVALEMALRTNPSYATALENLGDIHVKLASQAYAKALQLEPNRSSVPPKINLIRTLLSAAPLKR